MKKFKFIGLVSILILFWSCSFSYNNLSDGQITDVSQEMSYYNICRMPFMGGSLLYNASNPSEGQLRDGVIVAIRQGQVYIKNDDISNPIFSDKGLNKDFDVFSVTPVNRRVANWEIF